jgi:hypothetical protein
LSPLIAVPAIKAAISVGYAVGKLHARQHGHKLDRLIVAVRRLTPEAIDDYFAESAPEIEKDIRAAAARREKRS